MEHELVNCPMCKSRELRRIVGGVVTTCDGCGSVFTQAGIDALAGAEHTEPESPLDALSEL